VPQAKPAILTVALSDAEGGNANNVARVLTGLGQTVIAIGFAPEGGENAAERFLASYHRLLGQAELVIISGALPPGLPPDFYRQLVADAWRLQQSRTILDVPGPALNAALSAQPYLVKPNLAELQEWAGTTLADDQAILKAARALHDAGPLVVAVSMGASGLMLVAPEGAWRAVPPAVTAASAAAAGSGAALLAGFAAGLMQGLSAEEVLKLAVACGTASLLTSAPGEVRPEDLGRIRAEVHVERIS
jgi:1-phosphofructokinase family hexose kinase